jgi:transcriptional regulator with XRE-family HTH domain
MARNRPQLPDAERIRIGETLRVIREMRGYKQDELATELGISRPYYANIEAGRKPLTEQLLLRASCALAVRPIAIIRDGYFEKAAS